MTKPKAVNNPQLQHLLLELAHVQSALAMPEPEACPPDMVRHAYDHLENALAMLGEIISRETTSRDNVCGNHIMWGDSKLRMQQKNLRAATGGTQCGICNGDDHSTSQCPGNPQARRNR